MHVSRFIFPVESFDREFDAKLLLALHLLSNSRPIEVLLGYDKHITEILPLITDPSVLLDKSCSNIMYSSRFLPVLKHKGCVTVSDEEGVNNISNNFDGLITRFDPRAARDIHLYFTWGELDKKLALKAGISKDKVKITGNPRISLLCPEGRKFYQDFSDGLRRVFGDFYLVNENFCIETYDPTYQPPFRPYLSKKDMQILHDNRQARRNASALERNKFMQLFLDIVNRNPATPFVVRPHPMSDPVCWYNMFGKHRNVTIIYHGPVEPWLYACKSLISCGCTTALQAALLEVPVYHYSGSSKGYSNSLAAKVGTSLFNFNPEFINLDKAQLDLSYARSVMQSATSPSKVISDHLLSLSSQISNSELLTSDFISDLRSRLNFHTPVEPKWRPHSLSCHKIEKQIRRLRSSFNLNLQSLRLSKVSSGVLSLSNVN